ncbi:TetR/AcrR family transcriptional regulator [Staphylococcus auricularis]|uniref:TetR/AcrR family transcriptional regulator n=1 Tax=Staphylococcus auricularis TaxID=29379 RepID=UPI001EF36C5D|nr:TetR/AcrR family transcriptional regulator [Staphylococcus auricularis]MCG7342133.1 TetR/AcrR family transcriptional regulator [Staphylococcus auricularis]
MNNQNIKIDLEPFLENQKITPGKKKVLLSSIELFSKYGFNGVSTANIAKEAEVSEATIFKHFKNKRELLLAIITPIIEHCIPQYDDIFTQNIENQNNNLRNLVHFIVTDRMQFLKQNKEIVSIFLSELVINEEVRNLLITTIEQKNKQNSQKILLAFQNTNELSPDINFQSLLRIIMGQLLIYFVQINLFNVTMINQSQIENQIYRTLKKEGELA